MKQYENFDFPEPYRGIAMEYVEYKHSLGFKYSYSEQSNVNRMLSFIYANSKSDSVLALHPEIVNKYASKRSGESARSLHTKAVPHKTVCPFLKLKRNPCLRLPQKTG